jgi:V/A-type H+-transporting ATPase subunit C
MNVGLMSAVIRTHARIADLLTEEQMRELSEAPNIQSFLDALKDTPYGEVNIEYNDKIAINLERIFTDKFIERIKGIIKITPTRMGEFLEAYFNLRFETTNLKRILRGKFTEASSEEIVDSLVPIEPYMVNDYAELIEAKNMEDVVNMLKNTPYDLLVEKLRLCKEYDALWPLELGLNYVYASRILKLVQTLPSKDQRIVNSLVKLEADVENVLIAIKRRGKGKVDMTEVFPVTYNISTSQLENIIETDDLNSAIDDLGEPYTTVLKPIQTGDIALIRAMLRKGKYDAATMARSGNEFGFNVILAYLVYSEIEKDNLVGLAWGEVQGLQPDELLKYIVVPWG